MKTVSTDNALTVSQLNGAIKEVLAGSFPYGIWLCGEIQGYNRNRDKSHVFFELCEKDPVSKDILARIGLVIFSGRKAFIEQTLKNAENAFALKDDIEVKFFCKVDFYPPHGAVRLIVENIDPVYTLGKIAQEKQKLIDVLKKNGTLDKNKLIPLPVVPLQIGLITSYDSAAYNDFISELRHSGFGFKIFCRNTLMQGKAAGDDVCRALHELQRVDTLDAIVITRGGGSIAELSCFDSQAIAEKIAACRLPVLSGIGHEINITITDLASHTYQKTPTAIAQFITGRITDFLEEIRTKTETVSQRATDRLSRENDRIRNKALNIQQRTYDFLKWHHEGLVRRQESLKQRPVRILEKALMKISAGADALFRQIDSRLKSEGLRIEHFKRMVDLASPANTLKRGFSIARLSGGRLLRSAGQAKPKDEIIVDLSDGAIRGTVTDIFKSGEKNS